MSDDSEKPRGITSVAYAFLSFIPEDLRGRGTDSPDQQRKFAASPSDSRLKLKVAIWQDTYGLDY